MTFSATVVTFGMIKVLRASFPGKTKAIDSLIQGEGSGAIKISAHRNSIQKPRENRFSTSDFRVYLHKMQPKLVLPAIEASASLWHPLAHCWQRQGEGLHLLLPVFLPLVADVGNTAREAGGGSRRLECTGRGRTGPGRGRMSAAPSTDTHPEPDPVA